MNTLIVAAVFSIYGVPRMVTMRSNNLPANWIVSLREIGWRKHNLEIFTDPLMDFIAPNIGGQLNYGKFYVAGRIWIFEGGWLFGLLNSDIERAKIHNASGFNFLVGFSYKPIVFNYQLAFVGGDFHNSIMVGGEFIPHIETEAGYDINASQIRLGLAFSLTRKSAFLKIGATMPGPGLLVSPIVDFGVRW